MSDHETGRTIAGRASPCPRVAWWCKSTDLRIASVRMRAALLMRSLSQQGVAAGWYEEKDAPHYRCVVVSKRYDNGTVMQLRRFKHNGGRLVLDLCDNHFLPASEQPKHLRQVENLRALAALADVIVTSSEPLARIVARECPAAARIETIGDVPDDLSVVKTNAWRRCWNLWRLNREHAHLSWVAPAGVARLVWFGHSAGSRQLSGMVDLVRIAPMVANLGKSHPLHLTVISDNSQLYRECVAPVVRSSRYIEWNAASFDSLLGQQHIVLIPAQHNEYTASKSDNRVVTALRHGLAVVADPVPSYAPYVDVISLGDMEAGLRRYLQDPARRTADAARGQAKAAHAENAERVLVQWLEVCGL